MVGHVDGGLGRSVQVDQSHGVAEQPAEARDLQRREGFAAAEHQAQRACRRAGGRVAVEQIEERRQHRRYEVDDRDRVALDAPQHFPRVLLGAGRQQRQAGAGEAPPEQLPDGYVERHRSLLQKHVAFADRITTLHPVQAVDHRAVLDHDALGHAGRTGGIDDIGQVAGRHVGRRQVAGALRQAFEVQHARLAEALAECRCALVHQHHAGTAVFQQQADTLQGMVGIDRHIGAAGALHAKDRRQQVGTAGDQ